MYDEHRVGRSQCSFLAIENGAFPETEPGGLGVCLSQCAPLQQDTTGRPSLIIIGESAQGGHFRSH